MPPDQSRLIQLKTENDQVLQELLTGYYELSNKNVNQKRVFLGTLMTISAAITAGLFFLFSSNYHFSDTSSTEYIASALARISAGFNLVFIFVAGSWLVSLLTQEGWSLDKRISLYKKSREDFIAINNEKDFQELLKERISEDASIGARKFGEHELLFAFIGGIFAVSLIPLVILFIIIS